MSTLFYLDHLGIAVFDLGAAEVTWRRLGFTLTERSYHMTVGADGGAKRTGTGNHCIILERGYLELIAPTDASYSGRLRSDLARYQGVHLISLGTASALDAAAYIGRATGAEVVPRDLSRPFLDGGRHFEARFAIVDPPAGTFPEAHVFAIEHKTPEVIWQPTLMDHRNGAVSLQSVVVCSDDPAELATRLGYVFASKTTGHSVELNAGRIEVVTNDAFSRRFPSTHQPPQPFVGAFVLRSRDLAVTAATLAASGVVFHREPDRLWVGPETATGAIIEFVS